MRKCKDIIIYAFGSSRFQCPFDAEVWGCNQAYYSISEFRGRLDKVFLAHTQVYKDGSPLFDWATFNKLVDAGVEVINTHRVKGLRAKLYPLKRIMRKFQTDYFSDTICYMVAYAIDQSTCIRKGKLILKYPLRLRFYGVDMLSGDEYTAEKGGIEYWIGIAKGLGIKYEICPGSALLKTANGVPYGMRVPKSKTKPVDISKILTENATLTTEDRREFIGELRLNVGEELPPLSIDTVLKKVRMPKCPTSI